VEGRIQEMSVGEYERICVGYFMNITKCFLVPFPHYSLPCFC